MNRYNARMNAFAIQQLEITPADRVLDVGFGGGVTLPSLITTAAYVAGVDRSPVMVQRANANFAEAVSAGRAEFRQGSVETRPFGATTFGKACTVYFWTSLSVGCAELHRVLAPGGRLVVGFLPKEWMDRMGYPSDIFTSRTPEEVIGTLTDAASVTCASNDRNQPPVRCHYREPVTSYTGRTAECRSVSTRVPQILERSGQDSQLCVHAGEPEVRPPGAPTIQREW